MQFILNDLDECLGGESLGVGTPVENPCGDFREVIRLKGDKDGTVLVFADFLAVIPFSFFFVIFD